MWSISGDGRFRELEYCYKRIVWAIFGDSVKVIDIGEWPICGGGRLMRFYCIFKFTRLCLCGVGGVRKRVFKEK